MSDAIIRDAWELETDTQALLALAGDYSFEEYLQDRQQRAKELLTICRIQTCHRAFEIGSGDGTIANLLSKHCDFIDCSDVSASFLDRARKNCSGIENISFHKIGNEYLGHLPSDTYDIGYSLNVFIHLNPYDISNYLRDVQRILRVGGLFYFDACTFGEQTKELFHTQAQLYRDDPTVIRGLLNFNHPELIKALVEDAGLRIISDSYMGEEGWLKILVEK